MTIIYHNGIVLTQNRRQPLAAAFAVKDGMITGVGKKEDFNISNATYFDLNGRTVLPGFNDAHIHLWKVGQLGAFILDLRGIKTIQSIREEIKKAVTNVKAGRWIIGRGFNEAVLQEKRMPVAADLDEVSPNHPVYLIRTCAHIAAVNSKALELCKVNEHTISPSGGNIGSTNNKPNGLFFETALSLITKHIPPVSEADYSEMIRIGARKLSQVGVTSVTDPAVHPELGVAYGNFSDGSLPLRLNLMPVMLPDGGDIPLPLPEKYSGLWQKMDTVKFFADGGLSGATAALSRNYKNRSDSGILRIEKERFLELTRQARQRGFAIGTHAIGDRAIGQVLDVYQTLQNEFGPCRNRIEHFGLPTDEHLLLAAKTNTVAVPQPIFLNELGDNFINTLDDAYLERCYPLKTLIRHQIPFAMSTDAPVVKNFNPWSGILSSVNRKSNSGIAISPEEILTVAEAIEAYTLGAAYAEGLESKKGSIEINKLADFILVDKNPLELNPGDLESISTTAVYVNGKEIKSED
jgi:predicted amidohydrolase YtcJ